MRCRVSQFPVTATKITESISYNRGEVYLAHCLRVFSLWSVGSIALGLVTTQPFMLGRDEKQTFPLLGRWEVKERIERGQSTNSHSKGLTSSHQAPSLKGTFICQIKTQGSYQALTRGLVGVFQIHTTAVDH